MKSLHILTRLCVVAFLLFSCSRSNLYDFLNDNDIPVNATGVSIDKVSLTISIGFSQQLTATVIPTNVTNQNVIWTSSSQAIATVSDSGLVNAVSAGTATITVTTQDGGYTSTCLVTVRAPGETIQYDLGGITINIIFVPGNITFPTGINDLGGNVTLDYDFWIGETETTYELWYSVRIWAETMGYSFGNLGLEGSVGTIGDPPTNQEPVSTINWRDVMVWCNALTEYYNQYNGSSPDLTPVYYSDSGFTSLIKVSTNSGIDLSPGSQDNPYIDFSADGFRLLTAEEWEFAARYIGDKNSDNDILDSNEFYPGDFASGADDEYNITSGASDYDGDGDIQYTADVAHLIGGTTTNVKTKASNYIGLYDMGGNVREWCFDWYTIGTDRILRGGSFGTGDVQTRIGLLDSQTPDSVDDGYGFRLGRKVE